MLLKNIFQYSIRLFGAKTLPELFKCFLAFARYFTLVLIYFTQYKYQVLIDELSFPVFEDMCDKFLVKDRVLEFPQTILYLDSSMDDIVEGTTIRWRQELKSIA